MGSVLMDLDDPVPTVLCCRMKQARKAEKASKKMGGHGPMDQQTFLSHSKFVKHSPIATKFLMTDKSELEITAGK